MGFVEHYVTTGPKVVYSPLFLPVACSACTTSPHNQVLAQTNRLNYLPDRAFYGRAMAIDVESTLRGLSNEECATRDTAEAHWFARLWEATSTASWKMARYINSEAAANDVLILFN